MLTEFIESLSITIDRIESAQVVKCLHAHNGLLGLAIFFMEPENMALPGGLTPFAFMECDG